MAKDGPRSGDAGAGVKSINLVSAWASTQRLVLAQEAVDSRDNECAAILAILGRLGIKGATWSEPEEATAQSTTAANRSKSAGWSADVPQAIVGPSACEPALVAVGSGTEIAADHRRRKPAEKLK